MPTSRVEAFSDAVLAIAITLLVLYVRIPGKGGDLGHALLHQWPQYFAYGVSFATIGIMWVNHHALFRLVGVVDHGVLYLNLGLLMCIGFLPFPTAVVAEFLQGSSGERSAAVLYGVTLTLTAVFFNALWQYVARKPGILREGVDERQVRGITRSYWPGVPVYAIATGIAFASPIASVAVIGVIALFYMLPSRIWARPPV